MIEGCRRQKNSLWGLRVIKIAVCQHLYDVTVSFAIVLAGKMKVRIFLPQPLSDVVVDTYKLLFGAVTLPPSHLGDLSKPPFLRVQTRHRNEFTLGDLRQHKALLIRLLAFETLAPTSPRHLVVRQKVCVLVETEVCFPELFTA